MMAIAAATFVSGDATVSLAVADMTAEARERQLFAEYAECIVRLRPRSAEDLVLQRGTQDELERDVSKLQLWTCVPGFKFRLYMWGVTFQFALADAFIRSGRVTLPADVSKIAPLSHAPQPKDLQPVKPGTSKRRASLIALYRARALYAAEVSSFGECVIRRAPAKSASVLRTQVASDAERIAIRELSPHFTACVDKGSKVAFTPDVLRGSLALNYMRLANAPRISPVGGTVH